MVVRRIAWLVFIGAATPLDTTPSVRKVNRPQHFGLTSLEFPGRNPAYWDASGSEWSLAAPGPSRRVHSSMLAPRSRPRNPDPATHNKFPKRPQRPHNSSPFHPQVPHFSPPSDPLANTPARRRRARLDRAPRAASPAPPGAGSGAKSRDGTGWNGMGYDSAPPPLPVGGEVTGPPRDVSPCGGGKRQKQGDDDDKGPSPANR